MLTAKDESKTVVSFYKIDTLLFNKALSSKDIIEEMMSKSDYKPETKLTGSKQNGFSISLYYTQNTIEYSKWESFFANILSDPNDTFYLDKDSKFLGSYLSFICFFAQGKSIFALCMGKGYLMIDQFIEKDFGFNLLTRLIKPESNFIKQLSANHLAGTTFEDINLFRSSESFLSQDDFGKIFKQAISELDKTALQKLGINSNDIEKTNCLAKSSFMLKTGVTLEQITKSILPKMIELFNKATKPNFQINQVRLVSKYHPDFANLEKTLFEKMRVNFLNFDFFSPEDPLNFFMATKYGISKSTKKKDFYKNQDDLTNIENLKMCLEKEDVIDFNDPITFSTEIQHISISAYDDQDTSLLRRSFSLHRGLHGEIEYGKNKYFWMNGNFWKVDKKFFKYFNERVFANINEKAYSLNNIIPFIKFDLKKDQFEGEYNSLQGKQNGFINLDKKTPDGVELCDLLYETNDTIYLIHVKKGFDRNIRDLTSQILTAARFLREDRNSEYLTKLYTYQKGDVILITKEAFIKKFGKATVFVLAFVNDKNIFNEQQFKKIKSNIAKLEMLELLKDFKKFSPPFFLKIVQLPIK